jgi:hypothetical protein
MTQTALLRGLFALPFLDFTPFSALVVVKIVVNTPRSIKRKT